MSRGLRNHGKLAILVRFSCFPKKLAELNACTPRSKGTMADIATAGQDNAHITWVFYVLTMSRIEYLLWQSNWRYNVWRTQISHATPPKWALSVALRRLNCDNWIQCVNARLIILELEIAYYFRVWNSQMHLSMGTSCTLVEHFDHMTKPSTFRCSMKRSWWRL